MANEILKIDANNKVVAGFVTDDSSLEIRNARIDDATKGLKVYLVGGVGAGTVTSITASTGLTATPNPIVGAGTISLASNIAPIATLGSPLQSIRVNIAGTALEYFDAVSGGTVSSVSVVTANGVSGTVATATTTPAITLTLGDITPTTVNKVIITAPASAATLTIANNKTLTVSSNFTLAGTDGKGINVGAATSGKILIGNGTNMVLSTPTFPNTSATSGKIIKSDGTNWVASTETYATPGTSGNVMTSDGTNWISSTPTASGDVTGPGSSTDNAIARFDSTTGKIIQNSSITIGDLSGSTINIATPSVASSGTRVNLNGGDSSTGNGGAAALQGGNASANGTGGGVVLFPGAGLGAGAGGQCDIQGGVAGATGIGGSIVMQAQNGGVSSGDGGSVSIAAGDAVANNDDGGNITFFIGRKNGSGIPGKYSFYPNNRSNRAILDFENVASSDKTFTFPNTTGTLALTSDISPFFQQFLPTKLTTEDLSSTVPNMITGSNQTGSVMYVWESNSSFKRYQKDVNTGMYLLTHVINPTLTLSSGNYGNIIEIGVYIYIFYSDATNLQATRFLAADLTGETNMTVPVVSNTTVSHAWTDGTFAYIQCGDSDTTTRKWSVSGTTFTLVSNNTGKTPASTGANHVATMFDGTNVYIFGDGIGTNYLIRKLDDILSTTITDTNIPSNGGASALYQENFGGAFILNIDSTKIYIGFAIPTFSASAQQTNNVMLIPISKP